MVLSDWQTGKGKHGGAFWRRSEMPQSKKFGSCGDGGRIKWQFSRYFFGLDEVCFLAKKTVWRKLKKSLKELYAADFIFCFFAVIFKYFLLMSLLYL